MRDLLYLSGNKMQVLSPQVPRQLLKKAGFEAGVNVGFASVKTTLPSDASQPPVVMLDPVIDMIEQKRKVKWFTDQDLRVGDWVQFEDEFFYGDAFPGRKGHEGSGGEPVVTGLVYIAAQRPSGREDPFVLVGSSANVLDRWQPPDSHFTTAGTFYTEAVRAYAARLSALPDEAAESAFTAPLSKGRSLEGALARALRYLTPTIGSDRTNSGWATGPVMLRGHARVLAAPNDHSWGRAVLATPLYIEYATDDD